jgi:hypothetical protein
MATMTNTRQVAEGGQYRVRSRAVVTSDAAEPPSTLSATVPRQGAPRRVAPPQERREDPRQHDIPGLDALGLSTIDAAVYAALIRHPRAGVAELGELCDMTVYQAGRVLGRLVTDGMASRIPGRRNRYLAVAPDVAFGGRVARREDELRTARVTVDHLVMVHREATRVAHPAESVEVITGTQNILQRTDHIHAKARTQVRGFDKPPYLRQPRQNPVEHHGIAEGLAYRVIYSRQAIALPGRLENEILPDLRRGERARVRPDLPMKLLMADDQLAVIPISSSAHIVDAAYVIHPSALLDALIALFEAEWERATPVIDSAGAGDSGLDETDRTLITLLASGQTDAGIARALGWSPRTTQRRISALMRDLNVTTRFQAGLAIRDRYRP